MSVSFSTDIAFAQQMDEQDELRSFRNEFYFPEKDGKPMIYFCGNSLGLQSKQAKQAIEQELTDWRTYAVEGYWKANTPWLYYQQSFENALATIVGCQTNEVTVMNTLTVNLHFMMASFYRPTTERYKIIMEAGAFPSDQYAVETQVKHYGLNPETTIIEVEPRTGEKILRTEDIIQAIKEEERGAQLSLFFNKNGSQVQAKMIEAGIIVDYREPGVVRISPTPLYNSFEDVYQLYKVLSTF